MTYLNLDDVPEEKQNDAILDSLRKAAMNAERREKTMTAPAKQLRQALTDYLSASKSINEIPMRGLSEIVGELLAEWPPHLARLMVFHLACWIDYEPTIQFNGIQEDLFKAARGEAV